MTVGPAIKKAACHAAKKCKKKGRDKPDLFFYAIAYLLSQVIRYSNMSSQSVPLSGVPFMMFLSVFE